MTPRSIQCHLKPPPTYNSSGEGAKADRAWQCASSSSSGGQEANTFEASTANWWSKMTCFSTNQAHSLLPARERNPEQVMPRVNTISTSTFLMPACRLPSTDKERERGRGAPWYMEPSPVEYGMDIWAYWPLGGGARPPNKTWRLAS